MGSSEPDTLDEIIAQGDPNKFKQFKLLCERVFATEDGKTLLALLNYAVPPMAPSVRTGSSNDPLVVGLREGRREVSALLFRYAGKPQHPQVINPQSKHHG